MATTGYARYFSIVSLFLFSMTLLVLADNFILLFAGWEGVGLCSYLLIGYWYAKPSAAAAARKAFLVTRLGDVGLILGIFLLWSIGGHSFSFDSLFSFRGAMDKSHHELLTAACLLILCGAVGKSAQFPLYVWLPDAMEGPTPVSALIHAATMVTAGVYLIARTHAAVRSLPRRPVDRRLHWGLYRAVRRDHRLDAERPQTRARLFDRQPDRLHVPGPGRGRAKRWRCSR